VNLEYRRVGNEGGGWPGTLEDIRQAIRYLTQNATFEVGRLLVVGHSAGGQLAIAVAANETDVSAVVSLAGVLDLQRAYELRLSHDAVVEFLGGKPSQVAERYREADPMRLNVPTSTRQIIIHGSDDDVVPVTFSRDYADKKKRAGENVRLLEIQNANHFDVIDPRSKAWGQMIPAILGAMKVPSG
jgi:acetyl esterase/lipase